MAPAMRDWRMSVRKGTSRWFPPALVFTLAATATFAIVLLREAPPELHPVGTLLHRAQLTSDFGLKVDSQNGRLVLSWNRQNPFLLSATGGNLLIQDGSQQRAIHLDPAQLADGLVAYKPASHDVSFRLEVSGPQGSGAASMRVLDGTSIGTLVPTNGLGSRIRLEAAGRP